MFINQNICHEKKFIFLVFILVFTNAVKAQLFEEGDKVVNLGIGLGSTYYAGLTSSTVIPPLSASFELGVKDGILDEGSLGVGAYAGFSRYNWFSYSATHLVLGGRGIFHYPIIEDLDTYTGILLGFRIVSDNSPGDPLGAGSGIVGSWFIGGRYYFTDNLAGMLELGYGISYLNLGVAFKLD